MKIRLIKIGVPEAPEVESGAWAAHASGNINAASLPLGYWAEGHLLSAIVVGFPILLYRTSRNGVECDGVFQSSPVRRISRGYVETANSTYRLELIQEQLPGYAAD